MKQVRLVTGFVASQTLFRAKPNISMIANEILLVWCSVTPHVLRHSFASIANDLGFTEATIAALVGHSRGTVTSRYIHTVDTALIMAADYIQGLLDGVVFTHTSYALDRHSLKSALAHLLGQTKATEHKADRAAA